MTQIFYLKILLTGVDVDPVGLQGIIGCSMLCLPAYMFLTTWSVFFTSIGSFTFSESSAPLMDEHLVGRKAVMEAATLASMLGVIQYHLAGGDSRPGISSTLRDPNTDYALPLPRTISQH